MTPRDTYQIEQQGTLYEVTCAIHGERTRATWHSPASNPWVEILEVEPDDHAFDSGLAKEQILEEAARRERWRHA